jgi:hypothetical protein
MRDASTNFWMEVEISEDYYKQLDRKVVPKIT